MMIIIDDDIRMSEKIKNALKANHIENILTFASTHDCPMDYVMNADLIFLDIEMPDESGIEFAKRIRQSIPDKKIIFISSHDEYVYDTFIVQPFFFIRKTDFEHDFIRAMYVYCKVHEEDQKLFSYVIDGQNYSIRRRNIVYFEKCDDKINIHTIAGSRIKITGNLKSILNELDENFVFIDRSNILNLYFLKEIDGIHAILNTGEKLEISRRRRQTVKYALMDYIRRNNS